MCWAGPGCVGLGWAGAGRGGIGAQDRDDTVELVRRWQGASPWVRQQTSESALPGLKPCTSVSLKLVGCSSFWLDVGRSNATCQPY